MRLEKVSLRRGFVIGLAILALLLAGSYGYAKTIKYKSSGAGTFVTANFSYDDAAFAGLFTASGKDNLGGAFTFQCVAEYVATTSCTAPDSTAGTAFDLVQSDCAAQYVMRGPFQFSQVYSTAVGTSGGTECVSDTTGSLAGTANYTVTGGAGKLTGVSGSFTVTFKGKTLAAGPTLGFFGAETFTATGTISNTPTATPTPTGTPTSTPTPGPTSTPTPGPTSTPTPGPTSTPTPGPTSTPTMTPTATPTTTP
jgi:hypothetical protein